MTGGSLARFTSFQYPDQLEKIPFVVQAWQRWLSNLGNTHNVHVLDLFYWEHWGGNFAAMDQTEADIAVESLTPFSCRRLLTTMLSCDEAFRDHDNPILYREMIKIMWPEVLSEPVNPPPSMVSRLEKSVTTVISNALRGTALYPVARRLYGFVKRLPQ